MNTPFKLALIICLSLLTSKAFCAMVPIAGIVTEEGKKCKDAKVQIYEGNTEVDVLYTPNNGKFMVELAFNKYYTIRISKKGMVAKIISIDTRVKSDRVKVPIYQCDVDLVPEKLFIGLNASLLDFPMAIVVYNRKKGEFEHNEEYTAHMRTAYEELSKESFERAEAKNR
ncbi:MAG: hypothetical protein HRT74_02940 [Flavobacteriales bacterium]|nr:hypothetical protein [Flavobacteriales bacterium]